jgi:predicted Zn-dependent protease
MVAKAKQGFSNTEIVREKDDFNKRQPPTACSLKPAIHFAGFNFSKTVYGTIFFLNYPIISGMKESIVALLVIVIALGCSQNKVTDRKQLNIVSNEFMTSMADTQYRSVMKQSKVVSSGKDLVMVRTVAGDIASAVQAYYNSNNMSEALEGYKWEFNLLESKEVNAWCMPGGKIAVYTGLLPVTQDKHGLAIVLGHEIAHALAEHGKERFNQQLLAQGGALTLQLFMAQKPAITRDIYLQAFGVATELGVLLPFSRKQELEADKLGLMFAARAGYNPSTAIGLWERMGRLSQGAKPPEFASTHPSEESRIEALKKLMPEALKLYEASKKK